MSDTDLAMLIDPKLLSAEALDGLVESYCLRDWGINEVESPMSMRKEQVYAALKAGSLVIQYSELEESAHIVSAETLGLR